jgi:hypothetical protein
MARPVLREPQAIDCGTYGQIGVVKHHSSVHRNLLRFAVPLEFPLIDSTIGTSAKLHAAVTGEILRGSGPLAPREVSRRTDTTPVTSFGVGPQQGEGVVWSGLFEQERHASPVAEPR